MNLNYWDIIEAIVRKRGRILRKYKYFEDLWKTLEAGKQLIFLQAPTGAGKTEAVIAPFLHNLISGTRIWHSMLYVLPTKSLVHNMFQRFCNTLSTCREKFGRPNHVIIDYDHGGFLPFKAFMEGDLTVTTYDTLIYTFYGFRSYGHHLFLSVGKISGAFIVLDEVQLLQDVNWYAPSLLPHHLVNLLLFGATIIIISATIPQVLIEEILNSIKARELSLDFDIIKTDPKIDHIQRGSLEVSISENGYLIDSFREIVENYEKPMLLVFNTVERATNAYRQLLDKGYLNTILLHSRLISKVRRKAESFFEKKDKHYLKLPSFDKDLIVVATQVVESGIDFDFRTIATEICPMDSLIQRLGRCARKNDGYAIIFRNANQTKYVYPEIIVKKTLKALDEKQLSESVRNVQTSSYLINKVYTKEIIEMLRNEVKNDLMKAKAFIKTFVSDKIYALRPKSQINLLRLGFELLCILLPQDLYRKILLYCEGKNENIIFIENVKYDISKLLEENTLSISISHYNMRKKSFEIPSLKHKNGNREHYLLLLTSSKKSKNGSVSSKSQEHKTLRIGIFDNFSKAINQLGGSAYPFIINPSYYELFKNEYHLGLVKPYERK